jgi:hypothetical protein
MPEIGAAAKLVLGLDLEVDDDPAYPDVIW